jgi:SAM-dependent methyltransferase
MVDNTIDLIDYYLKFSGLNFKDLNVCELGNQWIRDSKKYGKHTLSKTYFIERGSAHTSIDFRGGDGSLALDLSKPIVELENKFNMVTNYGTSEHVADGWDGQYNVFKNIHDLLKKDGVIIHAVPLYPYWLKHGICNYMENFFPILSEQNDYELLINDKRERNKRFNLCSILIKRSNCPFIDIENFKKNNGLKLHLSPGKHSYWK